MITAGWVVLVVFAFGFGVLTGLYFSSHSVSTAKHRQPVSPRPVLMPPTPTKEQSTKDYIDSMVSGDEEGDDLPPVDLEGLKQALQQSSPNFRHEVLRDYYDTHSTAGEMENGHWEGLSGSLEDEQEPKALRPEETSSPLLGLAQGDIRPTGGLKPVFGETEHLKYDPEDYEEPLICQPCKRTLVKGETFWAVSLPEEGEGVFIPICDECEAKSHG
jgi:hypothetical protein